MGRFRLRTGVADYQIKVCLFLVTHAEAEIDLLLLHRGNRLGFEFKLSEAPKATKSMGIAASDLHLDHTFIVYPGADSYPVAEKITTLSIHHIDRLKEIRQFLE